MKIKDIFKTGGIIQSIGGLTAYLDQDNCAVCNKSKADSAVILHLKRESDGEEGKIYLRVKDEFKTIEDPLLNWAFSEKNMIGLSINQLGGMDTGLDIQKVGGKLNLHQS